jgi:two-component system OmpR family response regulator
VTAPTPGASDDTFAVGPTPVGQRVRWDAISELPPLRVQDVEVDPPSYVVRRAGRVLPQLPIREFQVLVLLMQAAGRVIPPYRMGKAVWDDEDVDPGLIQTYIKRLRGRLEDDPHHPTHIRTVRGIGYVFDVEPVIVEPEGALDA